MCRLLTTANIVVKQSTLLHFLSLATGFAGLHQNLVFLYHPEPPKSNEIDGQESTQVNKSKIEPTVVVKTFAQNLGDWSSANLQENNTFSSVTTL
jgi:hypothetical protein